MSGTKIPETTGRPPGGRKLTAVLHADVVGYSRLIGLDDVGTLERLGTLRRTLIDPAIAEHGGRLVNTAGDSLLIIFGSVDGAVRCAMWVQQQVPVCDGDQPTDRAIRLRVGINVGDVIPDGTDVHGEVVNVAARLQVQCPPGGICVSRAVRDHVQDRLDLAFEELGALTLKNIARPVEACVVRAVDTAVIPQCATHSRTSYLPLPGKPSIAVLAFTNMSGDLEQEYFSDGIADDIITELSHNRSLFVIARNSSFSYKGHAIDVRHVARQLGVRYVLEGAVRRRANRLRVTAQLVDAESGNNIWAERYDRAVSDVFTVQDQIAESVALAIVPAISHAEQRRIARKAPESLDAWEAYQRGQWHEAKQSVADNALARSFFEHAIRLDPAFTPAYTELANTYLRDGGAYGVLLPQEAARIATEKAEAALAIDPLDAEAHTAMSGARHLCGDRVGAVIHAERALALDPNSVRARRAQAVSLVFDGHPAEARELFHEVLRFDSLTQDAARNLSQIAMSYYFEGRYADATDAAKRTIAAHPSHPLAYRWLAAALGKLGRQEEATVALREANQISPTSFHLHTHQRPAWMREEDHADMMDGLLKAGWQGKPP